MIGRGSLVVGGAVVACLAGALVADVPQAKWAWRKATAHFAAARGSGNAPGAADAGPVPPTRIGINLSPPRYWFNDRAFANLMIGGKWLFRPIQGGGQAAPGVIAPDGEIVSLPAGVQAIRILMPPSFGPKPIPIRCTYKGKGDIMVRGKPDAVRDVVGEAGVLRFNWRFANASDNAVMIVRALDAASPIRDLDCREAGMAPGVRMDPRYLALLKRFTTVRFMAYQNGMSNRPLDWATRQKPDGIDLIDGDGVAIEDIIGISNATGTEPWVTIPWNGTDAYIRGFAKLMHDGIPADRHIYVELSNEVWNRVYKVSRQAADEGMKAGLATNPTEAQLRRQAQRTIEVMRIWEEAFRDRPRQLVRVIAFQHVVPERARISLEFPGLLDHVDAVASAPYFGRDVMREGPTTDLNTIFTRLNQRVDLTIDFARNFRAVAAGYGKRYVAYEAGQHILLPRDIPLLERIERDDRMYVAYKRYLTAWKRDVGDTIMLLSDAGPINKNGAWGLTEYTGQPASEAPKLRAVLEALGQ